MPRKYPFLSFAAVLRYNEEKLWCSNKKSASRSFLGGTVCRYKRSFWSRGWVQARPCFVSGASIANFSMNVAHSLSLIMHSSWVRMRCKGKRCTLLRLWYGAGVARQVGDGCTHFRTTCCNGWQLIVLMAFQRVYLWTAFFSQLFGILLARTVFWHWSASKSTSND